MSFRAPLLLLVIGLTGCPSAQPFDLCTEVACDGTCNATTGECELPTDTCTPDRVVGDFEICTRTTDDSYVVVAAYTGAGTIDLAASEVRINGTPIDATDAFDVDAQTFKIHTTGVEPSKYSVLFRLRDDAGADLRPVFVPMWVGAGTRYAGFTWHDSILYQIFTDRFFDGDPSNNLDNSAGDLARVTDVRSQWQGGDFAGITKKLREGYFEAMGVNTLWISSPILNSHRSQPARRRQ